MILATMTLMLPLIACQGALTRSYVLQRNVVKELACFLDQHTFLMHLMLSLLDWQALQTPPFQLPSGLSPITGHLMCFWIPQRMVTSDLLGS